MEMELNNRSGFHPVCSAFAFYLFQCKLINSLVVGVREYLSNNNTIRRGDIWGCLPSGETSVYFCWFNLLHCRVDPKLPSTILRCRSGLWKDVNLEDLSSQSYCLGKGR